MNHTNYTISAYKTGPVAPQTTPGPRRPSAPRTDETECQTHAERAGFLARLEEAWTTAFLTDWEGTPDAR